MERTFSGFTKLEEEGGISSYRLDANGLEVLLAPGGETPVATFMITYKVGSKDELLGETGATHFLEHMMFKGTDRYSKKSGTTIFNALQSKGARVNATTWNDRTNYYEMLPSEHLSLAIDIEADRMRNLALDPTEVSSEKTVILNEFDRGENEPVRKLYHAVWTAAYVAHPYHHPTIGWRKDIETVTPESLRSFYDRYYWPNNATISVIGGFDSVHTMELILEKFGSIPSRDIPSKRFDGLEPKQLGERQITVEMAGGMPTLIMGYKIPDAHHEDLPALHLLGMILSNGKSSRMSRSLVDKGLATMQSAGASAFRDPGLFTLMAMSADAEKLRLVQSEIEGELDVLKQVLVSVTEINRALKKLRAHTLYARDGSFSLASQLNEAIASGDWKLYTRFLDRAEKVTAEKIQEVAVRYFNNRQRTVGFYFPS
ncbi:insulinase family protein [bacterium]|nr:insulinase family protein [bacterium]